MLDEFDLAKLVEPLQNWFSGNARILPWREDPTPYYVWVSEIMLQQTRVEAVKPYFERFIRELPDVGSLAECPEDQLLKLWEGLGYYNRVRNLKTAAQQIMQDNAGVIPDDYQELLQLKGIGHYTAGAIISIAYGQPYPAVDGNVLRVISRVTADDSDIMKQSVRTHMEEKLTDLMQNDSCGVIPRVFNQALMELGATVCLPNGDPHCQDCPWRELCVAREQGRMKELPVKKKAKERRIEKRTVLIVRDGDKVAIHKRPDKGLLAGLYELPNCEGSYHPKQVVEYVKMQGYEPLRVQKLKPAKHIFSHVEWHMSGYIVWVESLELKGSLQEKNDWMFVDAEDAIEQYAIPAAFARYAEYVNIVVGADALKKQL